MSLAPHQPGERQWTVDDYMSLEDDQRFEVLDGELLMVPSPNIYHQRAITNLGTMINAYTLENDLGVCFDAPFDVVLFEDTVVQPDFTFVQKERLAGLYDGHCISGAPDLLIEVLSPATESRDRHQKRKIYARAGVPWLLLVEPKAKLVEVLQLNDDANYVVVDTATGDDKLRVKLFPELELDLSKVWFVAPDGAG
jgi:Uma2 family endonuclease